MTIIAVFGFYSTSSVTVFSGGILSLAALITIAVMITSGPMIYLLWKDITALRRRGIKWGWSRWLVYILAIPLPAWILTPLYYVSSKSKINERLEDIEWAEEFHKDILQELPPLSECIWTKDDIQELSDDEYHKVLSILDEKSTEEERSGQVTVEQISSGGDGEPLEYLYTADGEQIFSTTRRNISTLINLNPDALVNWVEDRMEENDITADLVFVETDSEIDNETAISFLHNHGIYLSGVEVLIRELEYYNISSDFKL